MLVQNLSKADYLFKVGGQVYRVRADGEWHELPDEAKKLPFYKSLISQKKVMGKTVREPKTEKAFEPKGFEA